MTPPGSPEPMVLKAGPSLAQTHFSSFTFSLFPHPCSSRTRHARSPPPRLCPPWPSTEHTPQTPVSLQNRPKATSPLLLSWHSPAPPPASSRPERRFLSFFCASILELISLCQDCNDWLGHPSAPGSWGLLDNQGAWERRLARGCEPVMGGRERAPSRRRRPELWKCRRLGNGTWWDSKRRPWMEVPGVSVRLQVSGALELPARVKVL